MKKIIIVSFLNLLWLVASVPAVEISNDPLSGLTISEFAAVNDRGFSTVVEGEEVRSDWIEIHNASPEFQSLDGWYLTDDPDNLTLWAFPGVLIEPQGHLIVWASGIQAEDHPENWPYLDELGYYHANFKLSGAGDYLALINPDLEVVHEYASHEITEDVWGYPPQREGVSYGLCSGQQMFLPLTTPELANLSECVSQCADPVVSHENGTFVNSFVLELSCPTPNAEIYYTLDGGDPVQASGRGVSSAKYTGPVLINGSAEVMVRAYEPNMLPSATINRSFVALSSEVASFSSNLPIIIVDTGRQNVSGSLKLVKAAFIDTEADGRANIAGPVDYVGRGGMRIRGSSSSGFAKKQFALETWDTANEDLDVSILGFPADSDWILYGPSQYDLPLISNSLAYELSNQAGRYAVRTRFCEMYLNTNDAVVSASDYIGLYVFMEKISRASDRVDVEKLEPWDSTEPRISGGYVLSIDRAGDGSFSTSRGSNFVFVYPKGEDLTQAQNTWIKGYFDEMEAALYGPDFTDPELGYAQYIDVNSFIDHHMLNMLPMNVDAFRLSGYMHKGREGKLELGPIWDFDRALNSTDSRDDRPDTWSGSGDGTDFLNYFWWSRFFQDPHFWMQYIDRWFEMRRTVFSEENLNATIDSMVEEIAEAQVRNTQRWPQYGPRYGGFDGEVQALKDWLRTRYTWIDSQFILPPVLNQSPGQPASDLIVTLDNPNKDGTIYYTLDGSDPWVRESASEPIPPTLLVAESSPKQVLVPTGPVSDAWKGGDSFDDSMWEALRVRSGPAGVGYDLDPDYTPLIQLDLESQMYETNASCHVRIPFIVPSDFDSAHDVILQLRYDDGFIAYINGVEVARSGLAGDAHWDSHADSERDDASAMTLESFDVSEFKDQFVDGLNILAIHGLNVSATDRDFVLLAQLEAKESSGPPLGSAESFEYTGPITLTQSTLITARVRQSPHLYSQWGGMARQVFVVGQVAETLRISELMYHPLDAGNPMDPNAEYIELTNIGDQAINLNQVQFTNGIDFIFPDVVLSPNDYVVVVKDMDAFASAYDTTNIVVVGTYTGSLSNSGERIELSDPDGQVMQSLQYKDKWYDLTDGLGFSLTVIDPADPLAIDGSDKDLWRPSVAPGGSPGWDDSQG